MTRYEYKVVPAPKKGTKAKAVKTVEGRFALSIEQVLNQMGEDGWEYLRAELLPSEERSGLTGTTVNWRNVLVFRRAVEAELPADEAERFLTPPELDETPLAQPVPGEVAAPRPIPAETKEPPLSLKAEDRRERPSGEEPEKG
ncbi:hypothetical protein AVO45_09950 [Ruegeria marisrubri]|uniref:DUF4177 domain-containing protein n=1 Tax=Ruegeria marisrubri TaxID=1685379 RepID=A0A0X3TM20_9RHOB|nr:DUF4177 domain-containing protein [Ruegeria marisrubri]KUJ76817.1 hypothetical protein AVO45_09950 [Ruegeria marisrubri]